MANISETIYLIIGLLYNKDTIVKNGNNLMGIIYMGDV